MLICIPTFPPDVLYIYSFLYKLQNLHEDEGSNFSVLKNNSHRIIIFMVFSSVTSHLTQTFVMNLVSIVILPLYFGIPGLGEENQIKS